MLPSTTLNSIEIKFSDNMTIIDTPGLLQEGSIEDYIDVKTLKKIVPKKEIRPITYQVKTQQWIYVEDLLKLDGLYRLRISSIEESWSNLLSASALSSLAVPRILVVITSLLVVTYLTTIITLLKYFLVSRTNTSLLSNSSS